MKHGFIGFGNVAKAIYKGLKNNHDHLFTYFSKHNNSTELNQSSSLSELIDFSDIIWLCVKPQDLDSIFRKIGEENFVGKIVVSPVAGKSINIIEKAIGKNVTIVRIMPNLAIAFQQSVTAFCTNGKYHALLDSLKRDIKMMGRVVEIEEIYFDSYTAIFGSGPAFLLTVFNVFKNKIIDLNIQDSDAQVLLVELLKGTTSYLENNKDVKISQLIENITSKEGTTEAGLNYGKKHNMEKIVENVLSEAEKKSKLLL